MFRSDKNNYKWIEITLPDFILVPQVKFFSVGDSTKYYTNLDVRVGNTSTTPTTTNVASTDNLRCEYKVNTPSNFEFLVFTCPSPGIIGNTISVQKHSGEEMRGQEVQVYDCPNTFVHLNNKCFKMMPSDSWSNQFKNCWMSRGVLLSFHKTPINELIAKKLMTVYGVTSIFLGMQRDSLGESWRSDWYHNHETDFEISDDQIETFVKNHVLVATLDSGVFSMVSADGFKEEAAICEHVGDLPYTNWGITNDVLEPDGANKCMKTCLDDANTDCDGKWKAVDCSSSLSYVCQIPCKKIPGNKDILLLEIVLTFHCLNKLF